MQTYLSEKMHLKEVISIKRKILGLCPLCKEENRFFKISLLGAVTNVSLHF
jgi:hypothetical protein